MGSSPDERDRDPNLDREAAPRTCRRRRATSKGYATVCPMEPASAPHPRRETTLRSRSSFMSAKKKQQQQQGGLHNGGLRNVGCET